MINKCYKTDGENLVSFIKNYFIKTSFNDTIENLISFTGRSDDFSVFFRDVISINTAGRIIVSGASIAKKHSTLSPEFNSLFKHFLNDNFSIPYSNLEILFRFSTRAVMASQESIQDNLKRKIKRHAMLRGIGCYMCGINLDFNGNEHDAFTCEHIWPREYGGNSDEDNLLPACKSCNSKKKKNFASWVMPSIQSLIHGLNPDPDDLQKITGSHKFAIHYKHAQIIANERNISIKNAFIKIGPWGDVEVIRGDDSADFFNLKNI